MGCCASREDLPQSHHHGEASRSRISIENTDDTLADSPIPAPDTAPRRDNNETSISRRPNASLRLPKSWRSTSRTWSRQQLTREREIFWETQVAGSPQIWAALRLAVDMIRGQDQCESQVARRTPDLKGAKAVLDAAGCTCPTGRIGEGVWDEQGRLYKLPRWLVNDPVNLAEDAAGDDDDEDMIDDDDIEDEDDEGKEGESGFYADASMSAGVGQVPNGTTLTARLSDRGTDVKITVDKQQPIKTVLRQIQTRAGLETDTKLKMAYMGRILKDNDSLNSQGWTVGHVVNILVFNV